MQQMEDAMSLAHPFPQSRWEEKQHPLLLFLDYSHQLLLRVMAPEEEPLQRGAPGGGGGGQPAQVKLKGQKLGQAEEGGML